MSHHVSLYHIGVLGHEITDCTYTSWMGVLKQTIINLTQSGKFKSYIANIKFIYTIKLRYWFFSPTSPLKLLNNTKV